MPAAAVAALVRSSGLITELASMVVTVAALDVCDGEVTLEFIREPVLAGLRAEGSCHDDQSSPMYE